jgi:drug/metabolite transporter (DMT)-like permease
VLLGFAVVGIELGFLLAYRYGSNIGNTQFYATTMLTLVLIPLGIIFFHEKLSVINIAGIAVCVVGFIMMHHRG